MDLNVYDIDRDKDADKNTFTLLIFSGSLK